MEENTKELIQASAAGLGTAVLGWLGMAYHILSRRKKVEDRQERLDDRLASQRLEATGQSNRLLYEELKGQIAQLRKDHENCEKSKAELLSHVIAMQAWIVELRLAAKSHGIDIRPPPLLSPKMLDGEIKLP